MAVTKKEGNSLIEKLFSVGAHFGYTKARRHPTVRPYIFGNKNKIEIFDLEKTQILLEEAKEYVQSLGEKGATILFVGGKNESQKSIVAAAGKLGMPYVIGRWIGGTFTNFTEIKKRLKKLADYKVAIEKGELAKYTKWERVQIDKEMEKLERYFGGITEMTKMPEAVYIVDSKREHIAVAEAKRKNIKIVSLLGSDCDLNEVDFPILGNDSSKKSIEFYTQEIVAAYEAGKALGGAKKKEEKETVVAK